MRYLLSYKFGACRGERCGWAGISVTRYFLLFVLLISSSTSHAVSVRDDKQNNIEIEKPAQRIITLAPYLTELLFAIDAGDKIVATVQFSDYPPAAKAIKRLGNYENINIEQVIALKPDIVLAWDSANNPNQLKQLEKLGIRLYRSEPRDLIDIATTLERFGELTGKEVKAKAIADNFTNELGALQKHYAGRQTITGFYQVWHTPIYTINGEHIISKVMQLCGIRNVFADLPVLAPTVPIESVLMKDPQMIIVSGMAQAEPQWLAKWRDWPSMTAVKAKNLFFIPPDLIQRHSLRMLEAARLMCEQADEARGHLKILQ